MPPPRTTQSCCAADAVHVLFLHCHLLLLWTLEKDCHLLLLGALEKDCHLLPAGSAKLLWNCELPLCCARLFCWADPGPESRPLQCERDCNI